MAEAELIDLASEDELQVREPSAKMAKVEKEDEGDDDVVANMQTFTAKELADRRMSSAIESGKVIDLCESDDEGPAAETITLSPTVDEDLLAHYLQLSPQPSAIKSTTHRAGVPGSFLKILQDYRLVQPSHNDQPRAPYAPDALASRTKNELKNLCRQHGLKVSGNKPDLIRRLTSMPNSPNHRRPWPFALLPRTAAANPTTPGNERPSASTGGRLATNTPLTIRIPNNRSSPAST